MSSVPPPPDLAATDDASTGTRVMVVEDDLEIRSCLQELLELGGHRVLTASNGARALEKLEEMEDPCLILLDLMMPVMDGYEFLEALAGLSPARCLKVVVLSASGRLEPVLALPHVVGCIDKPFQMNELLETVKRHCSA